MDSNTFMGLLIAAIVVLVGLAVGLTTLIVKPIINLNSSITELKVSIQNLNTSVNKVENGLTRHEDEIDNINKDLKDFEGRISRMEGVSKK